MRSAPISILRCALIAAMLDAVEISRGKPKGKPREKITRIGEMLAVSTGRGNEAGRSLDLPREIICRS
jgi:hypothetical protein